MTFYTEDDSGQVRSIANLIKAAGGDIPDWMLHLKKERKRHKAKAEVTEGVSTQPKYDMNQRKRKRVMIEASKSKGKTGSPQ